METAIQLWTLRRTPGTAIGRSRPHRAAGYDGVEFAGIGDPGASRRALDEAGLAVAGVHVQLEDMQSDTRTVGNQVRTLDARISFSRISMTITSQVRAQSSRRRRSRNACGGV